MNNNIIVTASAELKKTFGFGYSSEEEMLYHPAIEIRKGLSGKIGVSIRRIIFSTTIRGKKNAIAIAKQVIEDIQKAKVIL